MTEEFKQKAKEYANKLFIGEITRHDIRQAYIAGATEATKELQEENNNLNGIVFSQGKALDTEYMINTSLKEQIEKMKAELHHRLVSPSHDDSDCLDKIIVLDRLWQFGQEF